MSRNQKTCSKLSMVSLQNSLEVSKMILTISSPGVDTVISAVGRMAIGEQVEWVKLAEQAPTVKRFFPSEYGTDIEYGPESANEAPHQQKLKVRAALKGSSGLDYTYVVTGPYADVGGYLGTAPYGPQIGSFDVKEKKAVLIGDGKGKVSLTTPDE